MTVGVPAADPLILTLALEESAFDWFDALRRQHFPPARNQVPAHLTLFHALPGEQLQAVQAAVAEACARQPPLTVPVTGLFSLGRGVAYRLRSEPLAAFRARLAEAFAPWLTRQDQAPFRPHVTVQNKADPDAARTLLTRLQAEFEPFDVQAEGVLTWRYLGGPWSRVSETPFGG